MGIFSPFYLSVRWDSLRWENTKIKDELEVKGQKPKPFILYYYYFTGIRRKAMTMTNGYMQVVISALGSWAS
jgi:hypothetical protein